MSGLRERLEALCDKAEWGGHAERGRGALLTGQVRDILDDPAASTSDAPADTTLRDQIARRFFEQTTAARIQTWDTLPPQDRARYYAKADALLPLLRAHDAQVAAQARRDALNEARVAVCEVEQEMANEHGPTSEGNRNWLTWVAFDRVCDLLRDRAEQDTPDQANT
jgi:hypothetical protein